MDLDLRPRTKCCNMPSAGDILQEICQQPAQGKLDEFGRKTMFDLDQLVADCRDALAADKSHKLVDSWQSDPIGRLPRLFVRNNRHEEMRIVFASCVNHMHAGVNGLGMPG